MKENEKVVAKIISGIAVTVGVNIITDVGKFVMSLQSSSITIGEYESGYYKINKIISDMNPTMYRKHRMPSTSKDIYELNDDTSYMINLGSKNYARVETFRPESKSYFSEKRLTIRFYGKDKYVYREKLLGEVLRLTDERHSRVKYLGGKDISFDIVPHTFDNIILDKSIKSRIISGLTSWANSTVWYEEHQLVHKIGVFLYGKPGTGKSTIARAISAMFGNAPILIIDANDVIGSIREVIRMRKKYDGTLIVLIEDFDMIFKQRDEGGRPEECSSAEVNVQTVDSASTDRLIGEQKKTDNSNQNAIFQMLDGVYSTDDTIYIATTNFKDKIDSALIRHGRFDIQEELDYFSENDSEKFVSMLGIDKSVLKSLDLTYPVQPAYLQSKIMEYRAANSIK